MFKKHKCNLFFCSISSFLSYICAVKKLFYLFILCNLFFSCGEKKTVSIPATVLPKEKMAAVIKDIHLSEAEMSLRTFPDSTSKEKLSFQKIFEKDSITKKQYDESLSFYVDHPQLLDTIYEQVLNDLSKMQGEAAKGK